LIDRVQAAKLAPEAQVHDIRGVEAQAVAPEVHDPRSNGAEQVRPDVRAGQVQTGQVAVAAPALVRERVAVRAPTSGIRDVKERRPDRPRAGRDGHSRERRPG